MQGPTQESLGFESKEVFLAKANIKLHYLEKNEGNNARTLILIHGWPDSARYQLRFFNNSVLTFAWFLTWKSLEYLFSIYEVLEQVNSRLRYKLQ